MLRRPVLSLNPRPRCGLVGHKGYAPEVCGISIRFACSPTFYCIGLHIVAFVALENEL